MTARRSLAGFSGAILAVVAASYVLQPEASRAGQVVFIQDAGRPGESAVASPVGSITVMQCTTVSAGLRVRGRVLSDDQVVVVLATAGQPGGAGRAVGRAEAVNSSRFPGAAPGDFEIVLGWAIPSSTFAVVDATSLGPDAGPVRAGPPTRCPASP